MSETIFRFLVSELGSMRIICKGCSSVLELPLKAVASMGADIQCPACGAVFQHGHATDNRLTNLANALLRLKDAKSVDVEFSLPVK